MILDELARHPSNIAKSAIEYLETIKVAPKTRRLYEDVLALFVDSLLSDSSAVIETKEGEYLLKYDWDAYYGGAVSGFLDWWLPRKWMGSDAVPTRAPGILRKWVKWCFQNGYFEKERYDDLLDALPREKSAEVKRLRNVGELLYGLHQSYRGEWMTGEYNKIVAIDGRKRPREYDEGYMRIARLEKSHAYLKTKKERREVL